MSVIQLFDQTAPLVSGYSMRSKYITDSLTALGVPVEVFSSPIFRYKNGSGQLDGVPYHRCEVAGWNGVKKVPLLKEQAVMRCFRRKILTTLDSKAQLIDAHSSVLNGLVGAKVARKLSLPFLYEMRAFWEDAGVDQGKMKEGGARYRFIRNLETKVIHEANRVTVICEGLKNDLIGRGIDEGKIVVIPNGVDTTKFVPLDRDATLVSKYQLDGCKVIGFIGTFFEFEGLPLLVQAAQQVLQQRTDVKFLLVGAGRDEPNVKKMIEARGLQHGVLMTGRVPHEQVNRHYSVMDIMVYPRLSKRITELVTPLKPLEAMAMKKIVIGSDVGGIKELVSDQINGILFRKEDCKDLVRTILHSLDHPEEMNAIREQARHSVLRERNWLEICKRYLPLFADLGVSV